MTVLAPPRLAPLTPVQSSELTLRKFSVDEYQRMIRTGILTDEDSVELLEGWIVEKMPRNPPHGAVVARLINKVLGPSLPPDWFCRGQSAMQTPTSQPEPDVAVVRGSKFDYLSRHPGPSDMALVVEVSDSTLIRDREVKGPMYARASIPIYWIVNLVDRQIEVYADPSGMTADASYRSTVVFPATGEVSLTIAGQNFAAIPVRDILPPDSLTPVSS
jgi:Uma2 family endonuclease